MRGEMDEMKKMIKMLAENQMGKSADNWFIIIQDFILIKTLKYYS